MEVVVGFSGWRNQGRLNYEKPATFSAEVNCKGRRWTSVGAEGSRRERTGHASIAWGSVEFGTDFACTLHSEYNHWNQGKYIIKLPKWDIASFSYLKGLAGLLDLELLLFEDEVSEGVPPPPPWLDERLRCGLGGAECKLIGDTLYLLGGDSLTGGERATPSTNELSFNNSWAAISSWVTGQKTGD